MSCLALVFLIGYIAFVGVSTTQTDEGFAARIFQLLIIGQIPIIFFYLVTYFPWKAKEVLWSVGTHIIVAVMVFGSVILLEI